MGVRDREGGGVRKKERGRERKDGGVREREKGRVVHGGGIVKKSGEEWGSKGWKTGREGGNLSPSLNVLSRESECLRGYN